MALKNPDLLRALALLLQGCPYIYGGKTPWPGLDCSGFAVLLLHATGNISPGERSAAMLANEPGRTTLTPTDTPQLGDLAFYGPNASQPEHVMMCLGAVDVIGAHRGDHTTLTPELAAAKNAKVDTAPLHYRKDLITITRAS